MSTNINLLLSKENELPKRKKKARILSIIAAFFLTAIAIFSLFTFLAIRSTNLDLIKEEQNETLRKISKFQAKQAKLFILGDRIKNIQEIFAKRKQAIEKKQNLAKMTSGLLAAIPQGLTVENLEVNEENILISGSSKSLFTIGEFINNLTNMVYKKEIINSLTLTTLVFKENENIYQVSTKSDL